jgi:hypothetical protein
MSKTIINPRTGLLALMILSAGAWRLLISGGHSAMGNFTPVGAMALFGGCYFSDKWKAYLLPLLTLWLSDILLSYFVYFHEWRLFYSGFLWTYGSFALMVVMGTFIKKTTVKTIVVAGISAALAHWLITDFGVWMGGQLYPKTAEGLMTCYVAAIPYMKNMLTGNLVFSGVMFGTFELAQRTFPVLQVSQTLHANG